MGLLYHLPRSRVDAPRGVRVRGRCFEVARRSPGCVSTSGMCVLQDAQMPGRHTFASGKG